MREIKFRFWLNEAMYSFNLLFMSENVMRRIQENDPPIMQYTGLKDKHGKEIYEGDILQKGVYTFKVKWETQDDCEYGCEGWNLNNGGYGSHDVRECEVVGNIMENPDLLQPNPKGE